MVDHGILTLLALATLAVAAVTPLLWAALQRQMVAVVAVGHRRLRLHVHPAVLGPTSVQRWVPADVVPAHQAWRAPPTVWLDQADDPADALGRRSD